MTDLLEQEEDNLVKELSTPHSYVVRRLLADPLGRPLYWSARDVGWVYFADATVYGPEVVRKGAQAGVWEWERLDESQSVTFQQSADLKEMIEPEAHERIDLLFTNMGLLAERQWHPQGQVLAMVRDGKTVRALFPGATLTVRALMNDGDSAKVHEGEIGNARQIATELNEELAKLLPERARSWPSQPKWDMFNRQWNFRFNVVVREGTDEFEGEYKDLFDVPVPPDFKMPLGISSDGQRAWEIIVGILKANDDLHSGGHSQVFYSPEEWAARGEQYGEGSALVVIHDGGQHAPYFNPDYECSTLQGRMDLTLRRNGFYPEQMTSWGTAIRKLDREMSPHIFGAIEQALADREQQGLTPREQKIVDQTKRHAARPDAGDVVEAIEDDEEGLSKELTDYGPIVAQAERIVTEGGFEIVQIMPMVNTKTEQRLWSSVIVAKCPPPPPNKSAKAIALDLAKKTNDRIWNEIEGAYPASYSLSDHLGQWFVSFWFTRRPVNETSDDAELGQPISKEIRIRQYFDLMDLHIESMLEEPKEVPDTGWGSLGEAKRIIKTVLQPSDKPWTTDPLALKELNVYLREIASNLGEILETMDVDWSSKYDSQLGAWRITWYVGDADITSHRVVETFDCYSVLEEGTGDEDEDLVKDVSRGYEPKVGDIVRKITNKPYSPLQSGRLEYSPADGVWVVNWNDPGQGSRIVNISDIEKVRPTNEAHQEGDETSEEDWKELVPTTHSDRTAVEGAMAELGIIPIRSRLSIDVEDQVTPGNRATVRFYGQWESKVTWLGPDGAMEFGERVMRKMNELGIMRKDAHFTYDFASGQVCVSIGRESLGETSDQEEAHQEHISVELVQMLVEAGAMVRSSKEVDGVLEVTGEWPEDGEFVAKLPLQEGSSGIAEVVSAVIDEDSAEGDDNRIAIVGVFRQKDDRYEVLVCKREVEPEAGKWCIPGGHAKEGEDIITGAKREMSEETHLELGELTFIKKMPNETREATVYVYGTMMPEGDKAKAGDDAEKLKWVPIDDMPELAFDNNDLVKTIADKMELGGKAVTESKKHGKKGFLIVFEGIDGAGKTTQVRRLCDWLNDHGHSFVNTKWNDSKLLSDVLWKAKKKQDLTPMLFSLLHASDMHLRYEKVIMPALAEGKVVLADRYYYTSYVRDAIRDIEPELLDFVYEDFCEPDLVFNCQVPIKVAVERLMKDRGVGFYSSGQDVGYGVKGKEASTEKYEEDMAERYEKLFKGEPNVVVLDMDRPIKAIAKDIKTEVRKLLGMEVDESQIIEA